MSSQTAGMPRVPEPRNSLPAATPQDPTAIHAGVEKEKEKRHEEPMAPSRPQVMSANSARGTGGTELEIENTGRGRRRGSLLPRSAPPGARPPRYTSSASRSSYSHGGHSAEAHRPPY